MNPFILLSGYGFGDMEAGFGESQAAAIRHSVITMEKTRGVVKA